MSLTVAEFAELNDLKVEDTIETLNNLFTKYEYDYSVSKEDDVLDENALEFLEDKGFIIDESQKSNLKEKETEKSSDTSSQINFDVEKFFYAYKQINALGDIFEELSNTFNINISSTEVSLEGFYNAKNTIKSIGAETITDLKENINNTKTLLEEKDANVALLFKFLNGDFNDEEGFYDEDLIEDAMEDAGITKDRYGLMDAAAEYNQMLTDYYFVANWQNGTFLKEDGEIDYDAIDEYLKDNENVSSDVIERCKENQLFLNELGKGNLNGTDGEIDRDKVDDYIANHPLVTDVDTIIENYKVQVANTEFINNFEKLFMDEEGNIDETTLNQYLEDNPRVSIDIAEQIVNTVKDNKLFQNEMEDGKFFDSEGNVDQTLVDKFVKDHPYTTLNTEDIYSQYEENYANTKLWEEYQNGSFLDNMGNWDEDAYQNYVNEHPNATNGEDVKTWHLSEYPTLTTQEYQQQITQTVTVSFCCGVVDIFETVLDGGAFLLGTIGDALGIEGSKETMGQFIQKDLSGALYDSWIGELGVRSDIAYGKAHTIGTVAGKFVGTALLAAVPGGSAVAATVGALSAAGSAAETAFQSGADVEQAFEVAGGAFVLGAISGYGLDKVASSVKLGTMSLKQGLGAAALVSAAEPIGNSLIEYSAYGNKMTDSEGNVLYDNYLDYYIESGALLNTGIAIAGSTVKVGSSYLNGKAARKTTVEDTPKQALPEGKEKIQVIDQDADGRFHTTEYDADDSMFKSSTNMDDYVDVDNIPDYPSNKTPALGAGTDNALEVLDDATDAVDDASKGLTTVENTPKQALPEGKEKIQVIDQDADGRFHTTEYDADDSMFKSSTNMDDYVDVDNMPDYPSNKTPALGAGTDIVIKRDINGTMQELLPDGGQSGLKYYVPEPGEINGKVDFIEYARTIGYRDEVIDRYIAQIESDKNYDFSEDIKILKDWTKLSDKEIIGLGIDLDKWQRWSDQEKYDYLFVNTIEDLYEQSKIKSFRNSAETLRQTLISFNEGEYDITPNEVIIARMNAKNGNYTPSKQIIRNGVNYTNLFPTFDDFITDSAAYNYTKQLAGITDDIIKDFCTSKGFNPSDDIEAMAYYLEHNDIYVRGTTYQNAANGTKNLVKFGSIGAESQIYEISLSDGSKTVRNLFYDYTKQSYYYYDEKLGKNIFVLDEDINFSKQYGPSGGAYALLSSDATMAKNFGSCCDLVGGKLVITDMKEFGEKALSGVPLDNVSGTYRITYDVPINSCSMPSVNHPNMYTDFGVPGGKLLSGEYETVITGTNVEQNLRSVIVNGKKVFDYNGDFRIVTAEGKKILVEKLDQVKK